MSRRRRRDEGEDKGVLSENEEGDKSRALSVSAASDSGSELEDELDVSEYESVEEEERNSSDDEIGDGQDQPVAEKKEPAPDRQETKVILERKQEDEVVPSDKTELKDENHKENKELTSDNTKRESGDGKEESDSEHHKNESERALNVEDEKEDDPAFIPTKGAFFQHDMRSDEQSHGRQKDRKLWDKGPSKWKHDMFIMEDQLPKSRAILISNYGYDIREHPIGTQPPDRRPRVSGRGRGAPRGRNRSVRTQNFSRDKQCTNEDKGASDYKNEYPSLIKEDNNSSKHKTKSYYNTQRYAKSREGNGFNSKRPSHPKDSRPTKGNSGANENHASSQPSENNKEEKFSDILQVIQNREKAPPSEDNVSSQPTINSIKGDRSTGGRQNATFSRYQEPQKPKRYSSSRQKQFDNSSNRQNSPIFPQEQKYANFSKPMQPKPAMTGNFSKAPTVTSTNHKSDGIGKSNRSVPISGILEEHRPPFSQSQVSMQPIQRNSASSVSQNAMNVQPIPFQDLNQTVMGAQMNSSLMRMPPMLPLYNPMINSSYMDAALSQQQMLRMMSQMNISMDQMPSSMAAQMNPNASGMPPDPQVLRHPAASLVPPVSQTLSPGSLGSVMRAPHPPINPTTYFSGPMNYNIPQQQQQQPPQSQTPLGFHPSLVSQQFGGVTYFNTASQPAPVTPVSNQASPRRNAAIPIMAPTGFAGQME